MISLQPNERIIIALDVPRETMPDVVSHLQSHCKFFKIGMELWADMNVEDLASFMKTYYANVFLDLKLDDIPTTIEKTVARISNVAKPSFLTIRGDAEAVGAAWRGRPGYLPNLLHVPLLSTQKLPYWRRGAYKRLVEEAYKRGADGFIASGDRIKLVKDVVPEALVVSPGIRLPGSRSTEHKAQMTPAEAINAGADHLVIGRPILDARDPIAVFNIIVNSLIY